VSAELIVSCGAEGEGKLEEGRGDNPDGRSRATPAPLPRHSRATPAPLPRHSRATPAPLPRSGIPDKYARFNTF